MLDHLRAAQVGKVERQVEGRVAQEAGHHVGDREEVVPGTEAHAASLVPPFRRRHCADCARPSTGAQSTNAPRAPVAGRVSVRGVTASVIALDPCFTAPDAAALVELCARFGRYRMYAELEPIDTEIGRGLAPRHDALMHFLRTGGLARAQEPRGALGVRTSYFREEYAYGRDERIDGIGPFLYHEPFVTAAQAIHGRPVVEPAIAYANLMIPGQELAVHTDVPEFRGANRKVVPQWLLVVMHHCGLFDEYRMPIATGIVWLNDCDGGELAYWPDGASRPARRHDVGYNTTLVLDTDTVFHGVDRVAAVAAEDLPRLRPGTTLEHTADDCWALRAADGTEIARYRWDELRFSVSWKAYCFRDEHERDTWRAHRDDLTLDAILDRLIDDLRSRDRVTGDVTRDRALGELLIDEYVTFPVSTTSSTSSTG